MSGSSAPPPVARSCCPISARRRTPCVDGSARRSVCRSAAVHPSRLRSRSSPSCMHICIDPQPPSTPMCMRSEEHTSELQSLTNLVCRLLLEKKKTTEKETVPHDKSDKSPWQISKVYIQ